MKETNDDVKAEYRFGNAIVRIHGEPPENLREATEEFLKKVIQQRAKKARETA